MSNYVYANGRGPSFGAVSLQAAAADLRKAGVTTQIRQFTPIKPLTPEDLTAAQTKEIIAKNRARVVEELRKKGLQDKVTVLTDGSLQLRSPMTALDAGLANMLKQGVPVWGVDLKTGKFTQTGTASAAGLIDALPFFSTQQKNMMKRTPLSAMLSVFDPLIDFFGDVCTEVMERGLTHREIAAKTAKDKGFDKGGFVYDLSGFPFFMGAKGRAVNIAIVQPGDELFEPVSRRQIKSFRTLFAFIVLFFKKWLELHALFAKKLIDFLFPEEPVVLVTTEGKETNTLQTPLIVDELPWTAKQQIESTYNSSNINYALATTFALDEGTTGKKTYYKLSPRGVYDRAKALQEDWDDKYKEYEKDFCFWHIDAAARVNWLKLTKGMSERAARRQVAGEYGLKRRFATERNLATRFRVNIDVPKRLGGGNAFFVINGPRPEVRGARPAPSAPVPQQQASYDRRFSALVRLYTGYPYSFSRSKAEAVATEQLGPRPQGLSGYGAIDGLSALGNFGARGYAHAPGLGGMVADDAAGVAATEAAVLVFGIPSAEFCALVLGIVIAILVTVLAIVGMILGFEVSADLSKGKFEAKRPPQEAQPPPSVPPSQPPPPAVVGPPDPGTPTLPPPTQGELKAGAQAEAGMPPSRPTDDDEAGGGFPVVPVAIAAGVALLLFARR